VTDERDDSGGAVQRWRPVRRLIDTVWPRCSRFEQHPCYGREWLPSMTPEAIALWIVHTFAFTGFTIFL
jgi:hypothetical protein